MFREEEELFRKKNVERIQLSFVFFNKMLQLMNQPDVEYIVLGDIGLHPADQAVIGTDPWISKPGQGHCFAGPIIEGRTIRSFPLPSLDFPSVSRLSGDSSEKSCISNLSVTAGSWDLVCLFCRFLELFLEHIVSWELHSMAKKP